MMPRDETPHGMVWVPGGEFRMGSDGHYPDEGPSRRVAVDGFWMSRTTVTNAEFAAFVAATGYVTVAERPLDPSMYPGASPELLVPGALVFKPPSVPVDLRHIELWWSYVAGAHWRQPLGPTSSIKELGDHPVVQIACEDAEAYAAWAGMQLPTEAEWEFAARGGLEGAAFVWGDELTPGGKHMANVWQGEFPWQNLCLDGYDRTAPATAFAPNGYGLYQMAGNVWEWTSDWYGRRQEVSSNKPCCIPRNPRGGDMSGSYDPAEPGSEIPRKVIKGGSYLCSPTYCQRYRPAARHPHAVDTATCHLGFRCIRRPADGSPEDGI
ncbi:formylglycine-generating enzyme family protein [Cupriavidus pinatubonensis]|uniref:formylglycine-generating enzyme family protein n=1 Tax=Cupriavidus pinatubonensis TaxID=248026 RepID=UPI00112EE6D6|nr:formylglycine-generating enzyme family protein [Cupriavidus pinatubonensis]TPQ37851.1 gliding motility-associated lipoprotein GldK [Cupriavidus pinatubonensis]